MQKPVPPASLRLSLPHWIYSVGWMAAASRAYGGADGSTLYEYKIDSYDEADGRVDVITNSFNFRHETPNGMAFGMRYVLDSVSGATPVGTYDHVDPTHWNFAEIEDERRAVSFTVEARSGDHTLSFEYAHSAEIDYVSDAYAVTGKAELFDKNTILSAGVAYAGDVIVATPSTVILEDKHKETFDFALGFSQVLSKTTVVDVNLTYGHSVGYHSDPYRQISQTDTFIVDTPVGPFPVTDTFDFPENRPNERDRLALQITGRQYIAPLQASLVGSFRLFADSDSITSQTVELEWNQQLTDRFILSPFFRFYNQSAANYYYPSLTGTGIVGSDNTSGLPPNYSSDYRVSAFQSLSYGISLDCKLTENITLNAKVERYEMAGRTPGTPSIFFPSAQVMSAGIRFTF